MLELARTLWPMNRSLSGSGVRQTLTTISKVVPGLSIGSFTSGTKAFDWTIPKEWAVTEAYIVTPDGERICDYNDNNLHLVGYSRPFEGVLELSDLQVYLYSLESQPDAIPYVTSYYKDTWGFCLPHNQRLGLAEGKYQVVVRTTLFNGSLNYGEMYLPGNTDREILLSTYVCHPSMANNELSGPVLAVELAKWLETLDRHYSYRILFLPETIGAIAYMSHNLERMKERILAGFVLTCVGDNRAYSFLPSRSGNSVADKTALSALGRLGLDFDRYSWLDRGSDERQFGSPGADLPVCSVMRSKYGTYLEYHTSLDTIGEVLTEEGMCGSLTVHKEMISQLEATRYPRCLTVGEPQLGVRGLYSNVSIKTSFGNNAGVVDFLSYADGTLSLQEIASNAGLSRQHAQEILEVLISHELVSI